MSERSYHGATSRSNTWNDHTHSPALNRLHVDVHTSRSPTPHPTPTPTPISFNRQDKPFDLAIHWRRPIRSLNGFETTQTSELQAANNELDGIYWSTSDLHWSWAVSHGPRGMASDRRQTNIRLGSRIFPGPGYRVHCLSTRRSFTLPMLRLAISEQLQSMGAGFYQRCVGVLWS